VQNSSGQKRVLNRRTDCFLASGHNLILQKLSGTFLLVQKDIWKMKNRINEETTGITVFSGLVL